MMDNSTHKYNYHPTIVRRVIRLNTYSLTKYEICNFCFQSRNAYSYKCCRDQLPPLLSLPCHIETPGRCQQRMAPQHTGASSVRLCVARSKHKGYVLQGMLYFIVASSCIRIIPMFTLSSLSVTLYARYIFHVTFIAKLYTFQETFEYPELETHELLCNHLAPKLKGRPRGRRRKVRSDSPSSRIRCDSGGSDSCTSEISACSVEKVYSKYSPLYVKPEFKQGKQVLATRPQFRYNPRPARSKAKSSSRRRRSDSNSYSNDSDSNSNDSNHGKTIIGLYRLHTFRLRLTPSHHLSQYRTQTKRTPPKNPSLCKSSLISMKPTIHRYPNCFGPASSGPIY